MIRWLTDWESRQILKLRWRLFWRFKPFWYNCPYRVVVTLRHRSAPWPHYYTYVSLVRGQKACEIGPISQWSEVEAVRFAKEQWLRTREPGSVSLGDAWAGFERQVAHVPPTPPPPAHQFAYSLQEASNYLIQCSCGWKSSPTRAGHLCHPENCPECAAIRAEWEAHTEEVAQDAGKESD